MSGAGRSKDNAAPIAGSRINTGNQFAKFLLGAVGSASVTTHLDESEVGKAYGFYANDDWKIRRPLSLNLGFWIYHSMLVSSEPDRAA